MIDILLSEKKYRLLWYSPVLASYWNICNIPPLAWNLFIALFIGIPMGYLEYLYGVFNLRNNTNEIIIPSTPTTPKIILLVLFCLTFFSICVIGNIFLNPTNAIEEITQHIYRIVGTLILAILLEAATVVFMVYYKKDFKVVFEK